ncbi:hypothetical protein ABTZ78_17375 [Streptomyces bauhiniae]|uniref:hypothetical protein n=1 Tax=Streptomyces bauhiniae TaxID=2340725 RepID=UPI0033307789
MPQPGNQLRSFWPPPTPTLGELVFYTLDDTDVRVITRQRLGRSERGTPVRAGQVFPAVMVRVDEAGQDGPCNLTVFLDGPDTYWAQKAARGGISGTWSWPSPTGV